MENSMHWPFIKFILLLFLSAGSIPVFATNYLTSKKISYEDHTEIKEFANVMSAAGFGSLMNPPLGYLSPAVQQTQALLTAMVHELVPSLKTDGVHVVVNIYASARNNAFVRIMHPGVKGSREHWWDENQRFSRKPWPVRKAWGIPKDGKPIYEIGITSAMIESVTTLDSLAFVLGHELKHLTEGHPDPKEKLEDLLRHRWDSQAREGVADTGSLEYMVGKYELEAALTILDLLHPRKEEQDKLREAIYEALVAGKKSHHSEGLRYTLVQTKILSLRNETEKAAKRPEKPLPDFVHQFKREARVRIKEKKKWWVGNVEGIFEQLESNYESKKDRVNNLLHEILRHLPEGETNPLGLLSSETKFRLKKFMIENSAGANSWTFEDFLIDYRKNSSIRTGVIASFMSSKEGLKFLNDLGQISPEWRKFSVFWSSMESFERFSGFDFHELERFVESLGAHNPLNMLESVRVQMQEQLIKSISEANVDSLDNNRTSGRGNLSDFLQNHLDKTELPNRDPEWLMRLQNAFMPHLRDLIADGIASIRSLGILNNESPLFIKYFSSSELGLALEVIEREISEVERVYSSNLTPDSIFIIGELLRKYQNNPKKLLELIDKTYMLQNNESVRKVLIESIAKLTQYLTPAEAIEKLDFYYRDFTALWLETIEGRRFLSELSFDEMLKLFDSLKVVGELSSNDFWPNDQLGTHTEIWFELLSRYFKNYENNSDLIKIYVRLTQLGGKGFVLNPRLMILFKAPLLNALSRLTLQERIKQLNQKELWLVLGPEYVGEQASLYASQRKERKLADRVKATMDEISLQKEWPEAFRFFREKFAEKMNLQPSNVHNVFPKDERSDTERARDHDTFVRALSAFSTFVKDLKRESQIDIIEYMMGRQDQFPEEFEKASKRIEKDLSNNLARIFLNGANLRTFFMQLREKLQLQSPLERAFTINTVLAGNNSILSTQEGHSLLMNHILEPITEEIRPLVQTVLNGILEAEGRNKTLILSYILAQKPIGHENKMTEAMVFRSVLDFYGVPTQKVAQYLAFISAFKQFAEAFESYQDAAMPISYYEALELVQKQLGKKWDPKKYRITNIIGSGTVNIAIEYENLETQKREVLTISRDQIKTKTKEDFRRFRALIKSLMNSENRETFEFLDGLLGIVERSVSLEFNKEHGFKMQKGVLPIYRRSVEGWTVQSVDAFEVIGKFGIRMEKAPGVGATKLLHDDPAAYNSAMRALMTVEYQMLRGVVGKETSPIPLFANSDFHDGQVKIAVQGKIVTILDYGQYVEISNAEREFALDLLMIASRKLDDASAFQLLEKNIKLFSSKKIDLDPKELSKILRSADTMEVFVYLVSYLERVGFEVPLSVVHWQFGADRLTKLGGKIGVPLRKSIDWLLNMRKSGVSLSDINAANVGIDGPPKAVPPAPVKNKSRAALRCEQLFVSGK